MEVVLQHFKRLFLVLLSIYKLFIVKGYGENQNVFWNDYAIRF